MSGAPLSRLKTSIGATPLACPLALSDGAGRFDVGRFTEQPRNRVARVAGQAQGLLPQPLSRLGVMRLRVGIG